MKRRVFLMAAVLLLAAFDLLPLLLILKQAFTPERETFAWPPTWLPHEVTLENFVAMRSTVELGGGFALSISVGLLTVLSTVALTLPAAWLAARRPHTVRWLDATMIVARLFPSIVLAQDSTTTRPASVCGWRIRCSAFRSRFWCCGRHSATSP